jgi:hypothetical protein
LTEEEEANIPTVNSILNEKKPRVPVPGQNPPVPVQNPPKTDPADDLKYLIRLGQALGKASRKVAKDRPIRQRGIAAKLKEITLEARALKVEDEKLRKEAHAMFGVDDNSVSAAITKRNLAMNEEPDPVPGTFNYDGVDAQGNAKTDDEKDWLANDDEEEEEKSWSYDDDGGGGGASDDEEEGVDDVFEPALQRLLISMLLKNRRLSAADCARRICACDFSGCQLPYLREQQLVRGFVQYPFYKDAVHRAVRRLHPLLKPQF